ncbi:MAG: DUF4190 domain-containing protein [Pyrinomonadaceae bacterium]
MKKCPTCETTFEDSMRFCQVDGTPLVEDAPPFDPYATIVAERFPETAVETQAPATPDEVEAEPIIHQTVGSVPIAEPEDVLDLPQADPLKTMYATDDEMKAALSTDEPAKIVDVPAIEETPQPEPPSFIAPEVRESSSGVAPPPSPFSVSDNIEDVSAALPSVYDDPASSTPPYDEPATMIQPEFSSQYEPAPPAPVAEWTPPPAPDASWQNQEIESNTTFQPLPAGGAGQNKTLAIISIVCGILGMTVCCGSFVVSIAALILGFMARSKAAQNPSEYGGAGMAMGGIITGALGLIGSLIFIIFYFVIGLASLGVNR